MILPGKQIHLPLIEEGVFFVGPLNKNFTIETKGYGLTLGDSRDDVSVKAYVNGSTIKSTADVAVLVRRKQAVVEEINDATLIGNRGSYDGAVVVLDYGKINKKRIQL